VIGEAIGGLRYLTDHPPGTSDLPPVRVGISLGDSVAGLYTAFGVVATLLRRCRGGRPGGEIDVALTESVFSLLEGALPEYGSLGTIRQPAGGGIATAAPTNAYRARDGIWVLIAANSDPLFRRLTTLMGQPILAEEPRFAGNQARVQHVAELDAIIGAWAATIDGRVLEEMLEQAGVPATRAYTIADCADDPQFRARGMVQQVEDPLHGTMLHPGVVPRIDDYSSAPRSTGPEIGADNSSVLEGLLGYSKTRIADLQASKVI
jgi:crotonobetainyl-CoA:carnitine CoA-transferase CaiB-like acyl-CoA transferase